MPHPRGKTRKNRNSRGKVLTIPGVRHSVRHMSNYAHSLVSRRGSNAKSLSKAFSAEWKKTFGKTLPPKVADSYIKTVMKRKGTRKMRGGNSILSGAPLAALTRPDTDIPYGEFSKYVSGGFVNPEPAILKDCGHQQGIMPQAGMGSNKMNGGGFFDYVFPLDATASIRNFGNAATFRPFIAQNPQTIQHNVMTDLKGLPPSPGSQSWQKEWGYRYSPYNVPNLGGINVYDRKLTNDIVIPGAKSAGLYDIPTKAM